MSELDDLVDEDLNQIIVFSGTTYTFSTTEVESFSGVEPFYPGGHKPAEVDGRRRGHVKTLVLVATGTISGTTSFELSNGLLKPANTILTKQGMIEALETL